MERQALLAFALALLAMLLAQMAIDYFYPPPPPRPAAPAGAAPEAGPSPAAPDPMLAPPVARPEGLVAEAPAPAEVDPGALVRVETDLYVATLTTTGGRLASFRLKEFRTSLDEESEPLEMIRIAPGSSRPLGVRFQSTDGAVEDDTLVTYAASAAGITVTGSDARALTLTGTLPSGATVEKILGFRGDAYPIDVTVLAPDLPATVAQVGIGWRHQTIDPAERDREAYYLGALVLTDGKLEHELASALAGEPPRVYPAPVTWAGYADHYFAAVIVPGTPALASAVVSPDEAGAQILVSGARGAPGEGTRFTLWVGPKDVDLLEAAGHDLERAVNFGWFSFLAVPLVRLLNVFHAVLPNYGVDIILLTILVKVLFIPLTNKSMQSMRAMQKLQPQMAKLREKYKDDKETLNKEMIELYRRHRVNPLGGCLPMLLQFPVFIGLYQGLNGAIELRHAPFALWIQDLSANECYPWPGQTAGACNELSLLGLPIPMLVLLMGGSMILQQWMTPATGMDPAQQRMMMILMPVVFTVMFVTFPSGLVLYWLVNNFLTIAQQWWTNRPRAEPEPQHA